MIEKTGLPGYADDRYAAQREAGFPWLRFTPVLEGEYRASYVQSNALRIRAASGVGLVGLFGFIAVDRLLGVGTRTDAGDWMLLLVTFPALLVPLVATFRRQAGAYVLQFLFAAVMLTALSALYALNLGRAANPWFPSAGLYLVVMFVYFVSGLTFYQALVCCTVFSVAALLTRPVPEPPGLAAYEAYFLLLANALGALGHYMLERQSRLGWLLRNELRQLAQLDSVTGLLNHRAFNTHLEKAWLQAQREVTSVGLMLIDLDDFKHINDTCGHPFGDQALRHVAQALQAGAQRPLDAAGRYGGDELIAAWYGVDGTWLAKLAQELPSRIDLRGGDGQSRVTISGGAVLAWPRPGLDMHAAIKAADELLYEVKRGERGSIRFKVLRPGAAEPSSAAA
jgi:diguanylate cyclase (GGDEF)-like protein